MCTSVFVVALLLTGVVIGSDENQAKLRCYHNSFQNYTEFSIDEAEKIFTTSWYDPSKTTVVFTHGFTGNPEGPAVTAVITAYLQHGKSNVALLNWEKLAAMALPGLLSSYINWAIPNAIKLGADFAETLLKLSALGLDLNNTHFIGHSLGAHVFGILGNKISEKGVKLPCITGLDPATGFDTKPAKMKLNPASALFTAAIHTDPHKYGTKKAMGMVDFWPNYRTFGVLQPGCPEGNAQRFSSDDFCSHHRSWQLLIDSLNNPGTLLGSYAKSYRSWKKYTEKERGAVVMELGVCDVNAVPGDYYMTTLGEPPYGLGKEGL